MINSFSRQYIVVKNLEYVLLLTTKGGEKGEGRWPLDPRVATHYALLMVDVIDAMET